MNVAFVLVGVLVIVGAVLLRRMWPAGRRSRMATVLFVIGGAGKIIVGLVPENTAPRACTCSVPSTSRSSP